MSAGRAAEPEPETTTWLARKKAEDGGGGRKEYTSPVMQREQKAEQVYHYPPELLNLLTDAISNVVRSKKDVVTFFHGAGVPDKLLEPSGLQIAQDRDSVYKTQSPMMCFAIE